MDHAGRRHGSASIDSGRPEHPAQLELEVREEEAFRVSGFEFRQSLVPTSILKVSGLYRSGLAETRNLKRRFVANAIICKITNFFVGGQSEEERLDACGPDRSIVCTDIHFRMP